MEMTMEVTNVKAEDSALLQSRSDSQSSHQKCTYCGRKFIDLTGADKSSLNLLRFGSRGAETSQKRHLRLSLITMILLLCLTKTSP